MPHKDFGSKGDGQVEEREYMSIALQMAKGTLGQTSPNPVVGAVVVKEGAIVGMGAHLKAGEAHAEIHALRMAGEQAKGATIYVTLEPCSHHGRTPPCVEAILASGISRVVVATLDPNPLVAGRGVNRLREAGVDVSVGLMETEAKKLNEIFFHYVTTGRPFVTVKTASTLDGKIATETGHSRWITESKARQQVHLLRHQYDAILVGVNTVIADNPALTARMADGAEAGKQPTRIILDSRLRTPLTSRVVTDGQADTWICTTKHASAEKRAAFTAQGVEVIVLDADEGRAANHPLDIDRLLDSLGERGVTSLLVEGGAAINGAFLQSKAIQKIISFISFKLVGGASAPTSFGGNGIAAMDAAVRLSNVEVEQIDENDLRIIGYPVWG